MNSCNPLSNVVEDLAPRRVDGSDSEELQTKPPQDIQLHIDLDVADALVYSSSPHSPSIDTFAGCCVPTFRISRIQEPIFSVFGAARCAIGNIGSNLTQNDGTGSIRNLLDQGLQSGMGTLRSLVDAFQDDKNGSRSNPPQQKNQRSKVDESSIDEIEENKAEVLEQSDQTKQEAVPDALTTTAGREYTFENSEELRCDCRRLAEAGFFLLRPGMIKCYSCGIESPAFRLTDDSPTRGLHRRDCEMTRTGEQRRGRVAERAFSGWDRARAQSMGEIVEESRDSGEDGLVEGAPMDRNRMRGHSEPRCVNCNQDPAQESDRIELRRSLEVIQRCYYCNDPITEEREVCNRTRRQICHKEECQSRAN